MPEWSIGAVSKTVIPSGIQGSNPCLSARLQVSLCSNERRFCFLWRRTGSLPTKAFSLKNKNRHPLGWLFYSLQGHRGEQKEITERSDIILLLARTRRRQTTGSQTKHQQSAVFPALPAKTTQQKKMFWAKFCKREILRYLCSHKRKDGRVVECGGLENR